MWESELWILFASSFLSATLLPGASEANLVYLVTSSGHSPELLVLVATVGNTLGGMTNFVIGWLAAKGLVIRYFEREDLQASLERIRRFGPLALLFAWLPVIGDPLCLAAGYLKMGWWQSTACIAVGKLVRYCVVVWTAAAVV